MIYKKICVVFSMSLCCVQCDLNLSEGSPCTSESVNGTCVSLYKCYSAAVITIHRRAGYEYGIELPELCSYADNKEPVYCCTDCLLDTKESLSNAVIMPFASLQNREKSIAWNKCADYFQSLPYSCRGQRGERTYISKSYYEDEKCHATVLITETSFGGRDAERWQFPHMALLGYGATQKSAQWLCGGSVISERFILTAAHCSAAGSLGPLTYASMGILKRSDSEEYWKVYKIKRIILHPEYNAPLKYHDIALLETEDEIKFSKGVLPACLDTSVSETDLRSGRVPGWGRLGQYKDLADTLQVLDLSERSEADCMEIFPPHRLLKEGYNHTTQMCFGAMSRSGLGDSCEGDSGGPLQTALDCLYTVMGVTSYGKNCEYANSAGMYTRVSFYIPWIESVVWPELYKDYYK